MQQSRLVELAIRGLEGEKTRIENELSELKKQRTGVRGRSVQARQTQKEPVRRRRKMTAAARKRISEAMKKRHAERRAAAQR